MTNRLLLIIGTIIVGVTVVACGGGGGSSSSATPGASTTTAYTSGAQIGELVSFSVTNDSSGSPASYSYVITKSAFGCEVASAACHTGSGTLSLNSDGTYTPSQFPQSAKPCRKAMKMPPRFRFQPAFRAVFPLAVRRSPRENP